MVWFDTENKEVRCPEGNVLLHPGVNRFGTLWVICVYHNHVTLGWCQSPGDLVYVILFVEFP